METTKPNPHQTAEAYYTLFLSLPEDVQREIRQMVSKEEKKVEKKPVFDVSLLHKSDSGNPNARYNREEIYGDDEQND